MNSDSYQPFEGEAAPTLEDFLLPPDLDLSLDAISAGENLITLRVTASAPQADCPRCTQPSWAVHSRYQRRVADLPFVGLRVLLKLHVRKFFCRNPVCPRRIFTERLTPLVKAYARRTTRLRQLLEQLALQLGGESGARLAGQHGMPISHDTLLRLVRGLPEAEATTPRVLGVDDWARRKGQRYGTILVDLERHRVIDLLPDGEADTVVAWLKDHPGIQIIARDRAGGYAEAATRGASGAQQVADRFHLLQNLREAIQRLLDRQQKVLRQVSQADHANPATESSTEPSYTVKASSLSIVAGPIHEQPIRAQERRQRSRARRLMRFEEVHALQQQGLSQRAIAKEMRINRRTVRRFLEADAFPERARPPRPRSILDPFVAYLTEQMRAGRTNGMQLWRELREQGYTGSRSLLSSWVAHYRHLGPTDPKSSNQQRTRGRPPNTAASALRNLSRPLSAKQASWLAIRPPSDLDDDQKQSLARLRELSPEMETAYPLAQEFVQMVRLRAGPSFESWLEKVRNSKVRELVNFARSLEHDKVAVIAGLSLPYNNGQVEGQINRLKLIKRSMYGRARLDLLRKRVLAS